MAEAKTTKAAKAAKTTEKKPKSKTKATKQANSDKVSLQQIWQSKLDAFNYKMKLVKGEEKNTNKLGDMRRKTARLWTEYNKQQHGK